MKVTKGFFGTTFEFTADEVQALARGEEISDQGFIFKAPAPVPSIDEDQFPLYGYPSI